MYNPPPAGSLLLDTHAFLWMIRDAAKLSPAARAAVGDPAALLYLSMASIWEISLKVGLGKLALPTPLRPFLRSQMRTSGTSLLPIDFDDAVHVSTLPHHHGDPFDRMIVTQALRLNLLVVGKVKAFDAYGVTRIW